MKPRNTVLTICVSCVLCYSSVSGEETGKHLFVLSGQSNMQGHRPAEAFTPTVAEALGKDQVIVIQDAQGGQPIRRWYKRWKSPARESPGDLYDQLMKKVKPAITGETLATVTFIWMQGERDARMQWGDVYETSLKGLHEQFSKDLGRSDVNFVIGRLSDFDLENRSYRHWTMIRKIQTKVADSNSRFAWVDTDDLNDGVNRRGKSIRNDLHYSAEGYKRLGKRFARSALELIHQHSGDLSELRTYGHQIVYEAYVDDNWELMAMNADGSGKTNLTNTPHVHEMYPQASFDGTKICCVVDTQEDGKTVRGVWYMNADGTERVKVAARARQPFWHPDGTKIAFLAQEFKRFSVKTIATTKLVVFDLKTRAKREHANRQIHHLFGPGWSPDGRWIVSTVHGGMGFGHAIIAIESDGQQFHDLQIPGCRPNISPAGTRLTWSSNDHTISIADVDFTSSVPTVSNVQVLDQRVELHLYHPDFSPDGKYISYSVGPGGRMPANGRGTHTDVAETVGVRGKWNLFIKRADGQGSPIQLTRDEDRSNKESEWVRKSTTTGNRTD